MSVIKAVTATRQSTRDLGACNRFGIRESKNTERFVGRLLIIILLIEIVYKSIGDILFLLKNVETKIPYFRLKFSSRILFDICYVFIIRHANGKPLMVGIIKAKLRLYLLYLSILNYNLGANLLADILFKLLLRGIL